MSTTQRTAETHIRFQPIPADLQGFIPMLGPSPRLASGHCASEEAPVDMSRLRSMVDDDPASMRELVDLYLTESGELMRSLRTAINKGSTTEAEWVAHRLGGTSATCGMTGLVAPLRELERSGKAGCWPENEELLNEADRQHALIRAYLAAHVTQTGSCVRNTGA